MRRLSAALLVVTAAALVAALPAAGKEGVKATLTTPIPLAASPGTKLDVGWTLASLDEHGRRQPFGGGRVFVRLLSASGADPETAFTQGSGAYEATVTVPKGGIGDVQIGIQSWTNGPSGTKQADWLFPITNDPLPGATRIAAEPKAGASWPWIVLVVAVGLSFALLLAGVAVARRKHVLPA